MNTDPGQNETGRIARLCVETTLIRGFHRTDVKNPFWQLMQTLFAHRARNFRRAVSVVSSWEYCVRELRSLELRPVNRFISRISLPLLLALGAMFFDIEHASSQSKINYKVIRNLEPMKESSSTPDFSIPGFNGKMISLKDFRGKTVLLNFWATWCAPCREEMPGMERLYQEFKDRNFVILAVNVKDRKQDALSFLEELKITYPAAFDPDGQVGLLYGAWGLPTTYLIGPRGEGLARAWGPADWHSPAARTLISQILAEKK